MTRQDNIFWVYCETSKILIIILTWKFRCILMNFSPTRFPSFIRKRGFFYIFTSAPLMLGWIFSKLIPPKCKLDNASVGCLCVSHEKSPFCEISTKEWFPVTFGVGYLDKNGRTPMICLNCPKNSNKKEAFWFSSECFYLVRILIWW